MTDRRTPSQPFRFTGDWTGPVVATAIHDGHELRPEIAEAMTLVEDVRLREEDPFTSRIMELMPARVSVARSRFEVDLNRSRQDAVYRTPDDAWDLEVWRQNPLDERLVAGSLSIYDDFYAELTRRLDGWARKGPFVVYDVHSYNHRREGPDHAPAPAIENPEVNVGTGALDRDRWAPVVDTFIDSLSSIPSSTGTLDVRENVRFKGGHLSRWVRGRYPETGIVLALEFKKTFMDEWTGVPDEARLGELAEILASTIPAVERALEKYRA